MNTPTDAVTWLHVPYSERNFAKDSGARWDPEERRWYARRGADLSDLRRWTAATRIYLKVPYEQKDVAKAHGARWDPSYRAWYISEDVDRMPFAQWID